METHPARIEPGELTSAPETYADLRPYVIRETNEYVCVKLPPAIARLLNMEDPNILKMFVAMERNDSSGEILAVKRPGVHEPLYKEDPPFAIMDLIARGLAMAEEARAYPKEIHLNNWAISHLSNELAQFIGGPRRSSMFGLKIVADYRVNQRVLITGNALTKYDPARHNPETWTPDPWTWEHSIQERLQPITKQLPAHAIES